MSARAPASERGARAVRGRTAPSRRQLRVRRFLDREDESQNALDGRVGVTQLADYSLPRKNEHAIRCLGEVLELGGDDDERNPVRSEPLDQGEHLRLRAD